MAYQKTNLKEVKRIESIAP